MSHTHNPSTVEAEAEGSHVQNRPGLYKEDLVFKNKTKSSELSPYSMSADRKIQKYRWSKSSELSPYSMSADRKIQKYRWSKSSELSPYSMSADRKIQKYRWSKSSELSPTA
ncbi:hypothetical protein LEMLEM_LOCUS3231 [Lemmus lemmus]